MVKQYWLFNAENGDYLETHLYENPPSNSTDVKPLVDLKFARWTGTSWIIPEDKQFELALEIEKKKMKRRITDGIQAVAKMTAEYNIAVKAGYVTEEVNLASHNALKSVRDEIINGCWDKALYQLDLVDKDVIGLDLYNRIGNQITNYINNTNY